VRVLKFAFFDRQQSSRIETVMLSIFGSSTRRQPLRRRSDARLIERTISAQRLQSVTGEQLRQFSDQLRENIVRTSTLDDESILETGLALTYEAIRRVHGISLYDVQLLAGIVLTRGGVAEMATGEGKTLTAAIPAVIHGLRGRGVHVATSNAYLAERDCEELTPVFEILGLTAGLLEEQGPPDGKRHAYRCDVTYGAGHEFGFDYLRDQTVVRDDGKSPLGKRFQQHWWGNSISSRILQRGLSFAIVDEIDNVLLDDAISPLLISEHTDDEAEDACVHRHALQLLEGLQREQHYQVAPITTEIRLTEAGLERIHQSADVGEMSLLLRPWESYVLQALRAKEVMKRDVDYIVQNDEVCIVDESTGRIFEDRSWKDGLHQAVEAKEGLKITGEMKALARITRQRFYRLYGGMCGMTGTATGSESEFRTVYKVDVCPIPLRLPSQRTMLPTRYFPDAESKRTAIVEEIQTRHAAGQPVLVGTRSIGESSEIAELLNSSTVPFQLLNGTQDEEEADIIAGAGAVGAVTIATNLAGRGTDIKPSDEALAVGGLHVIAAERHSSNRIDRQLVGRSARKGDPGSAQFFVSADDELVINSSPHLARRMKRLPTQGRQKTFDGAILKKQRTTEKRLARQRQHMLQADMERDSTLAKLWGHSS